MDVIGSSASDSNRPKDNSPVILCDLTQIKNSRAESNFLSFSVNETTTSIERCQLKAVDRKWILFVALASLLALYWRAREREAVQPGLILLQGETMGTTWSVQLADLPLAADPEWVASNLEREIGERLQQINASLSTWDPTSLISRLNRAPADSLVQLDEDFREVLALSGQVYRESRGAFDPGIGPLIEAWGFGSSEAGPEPDARQLEAARRVAGLQAFSWQEEPSVWSIRKSHSASRLDFSAVAKGWAVDQLGRILVSRGAGNWCAEIGGEVLCSGSPPGLECWRIGVQNPREGPPADQLDLQTRICLTSGALATSGSYRNYRRFQERKLPHILDPRSGRPIESSTVSVTVLAPACGHADALATALMVLGPQEGMEIVAALDEVEALFLLDDGQGGFRQWASPGMEARMLASDTADSRESE